FGAISSSGSDVATGKVMGEVSFNYSNSLATPLPPPIRQTLRSQLSGHFSQLFITSPNVPNSLATTKSLWPLPNPPRLFNHSSNSPSPFLPAELLLSSSTLRQLS